MAELKQMQGWDSGVGATLQAHRIQRGVELSAVAETLNVRDTFLRAIEEGRYEDLPGPTYAAGFVRAYAEHLGLDADQAVRQFKLETLGRTIGVDLHFPEPESERGIPRTAILVASALLLALAYGTWYVLSPTGGDGDVLVTAVPERLAPTPAGEPAPVAVPPPADVGPPQAAREQDPAPVVGEAEPPLPDRGAGDGADAVDAPQPAGQDPGADRLPQADVPQADVPQADVPQADTAPADMGQAAAEIEDRGAAEPITDVSEAVASGGEEIVLRATAASWIELRDGDGGVVLDRILQPGETVSVDAGRGLSLATGNAGGLQIVLDGEVLPPLGGSGAVRRGVALDFATLRPAAAPPALAEAVAEREDGEAVPAGPEELGGSDGTAAGGERIVLRATAESWIEVRDGSGRIVVSRVLLPGETVPVDATRGLTLVTGNAGGLEVILDGEVLPPLGPPGAVRRGIVLDPEALPARAGR